MLLLEENLLKSKRNSGHEKLGRMTLHENRVFILVEEDLQNLIRNKIFNQHFLFQVPERMSLGLLRRKYFRFA